MRLTAVAFGALAGAMLVYSQEAAEAARSALSLFAFSVAPVLGPFMACMLMLSSRMSGGIARRIMLSWLCGSPGGGKIMLMMRPDDSSALQCAAITGTMSPMFFLGAVAGWLQNRKAGVLLLFCHLVSAGLLALFLPRGKTDPTHSPSPMALGAALRESSLSLLSIALCMMLGCVAAKMAACALPHLPEGLAILLQCVLEITAGAEKIAFLNTPWKIPLLCGACSFGGLSLLMQNAAVWQDTGMKISQLFMLRLAHGGIAFVICGILWQFLA